MKINISTELYPDTFTLVDQADFEALNQFKWHMNSYGYAQRGVRVSNTKKIWLKMHRVILDAKCGEIVDHADHNPLNNCRSNLRIVTPAQNNMNSRGKAGKQYKGVNRCKKGCRYQASIGFEGRSHYLGIYKTPEEAAAVYNAAAIRFFGEYACINYIPPEII